MTAPGTPDGGQAAPDQVVTGDAVALELNPAGLASRIAAILLDVIVQAVMLTAVVVVVGVAAPVLDTAVIYALFAALPTLIIIGYPTAFETMTRGRSLGKIALGLRVMGTDGSPERFRQALVRALVAPFEFWSPALFSAVLNPAGRRIGDFLAGTIVVQERGSAGRTEVIGMPPRLWEWAATAELSQVDPDTVAMARQYVLRFGELQPHARHEMGVRVATTVAQHVTPPPPPDTTPVEFLAAVVAERRRRDEERMARRQAGGGPGARPW